ncbi:unnamed protein product [Heterobilharzia americana]|nr:unnamed protein product [Heterobilharzia americana]
MSESEDNSQLNFFNLNFGAWNNGCNLELVNNDIWPLNSGPYLAHKHDSLGLPPVNKQSGKSSGDSKLDGPNLFSWSSNNPLIRPANKMSIWSTDVQSRAKSRELSSSLWGSTVNENDQLASEDVWDSSHDPVVHIPKVGNELESWKLDRPQCLGSSDVSLPVVDSEINNVSRELELPHLNIPVNNLPDVNTMLSGLTITPRNSEESPSQTKTSASCASANDPATVQALSTEQLFDRLINTNEGWGRRPIDQATPWEPLDSKISDQINRSGITTPTPGACSSGYLAGNFRISSQPHTSDSNFGGRSAAWQAESQSLAYRDMISTPQVNPSNLMNCSLNTNPRAAPQLQPSRPGDCREWEDNESRLVKNWNVGLSGSSDRTNLLWNSPTVAADCDDQVGGGAIHRRHPTTIVSHPEAPWGSGNTVHPSSGRPVLGGTRAILPNNNQSDDVTLDGDSNFLRSGVNPNTIVAWETSSNGVVSTTWGSTGNTGLINSMQTQLPSSTDDVRRQQNYLGSISVTQGSDRLQVHPYSNTYRADLVKYLMSQGFKKEDAHAALIACNMEPEKALSELRERYSTNRTMNAMTQPLELGRNYGANGVSHTVTRSGPIHQLSNDASLSQFSLSGSNSTASAPNHRLKQPGSCVTTQSYSNQLLAMQPVPNSQLMRQQITQQVRSALNLSLPNPLGVQINGNAAVGACGGSLLGQPPPPSLSNVNLNSHTAPSANSHQITGLAPITSLGPAKNNIRTPTTPASYNQNSMKRSPRQMAIINSIIELQKKHQSIQHQLTVYHNNPALRSQPQYADVFVELQGQMQQIETQLYAKRTQLNLTRAQDLGAQSTRTTPLLLPNCVDVSDNSFPAIGTWMAPSSNCGENFDKTPTDALGSRLNNFTRTAVSKVSSNWSPVWSASNASNQTTSNLRLTHAQWQQGNSHGRTGLENNLNLPVGKNNLSGNMHGEAPPQGQWLLVQPLLGWTGANIHNLQNILSTHFKLTSFHVLNPNTNSVLIKLQNIEETIQLVKNFGDRLALEPLSELDARVHLEQVSLNACSDGLTSNQFNTLPELHVTSSNWNANGQFYSSLNNSNNKKPNPQISRFGITVCGNK